jgi:hypothetical protein
MAGFNYGIARVPDLGGEPLTCSARHCQEPPNYYARYDYVTGRRGRITTASRYYCQAHAEAFARRHGFPWPPTVALAYRQTRRTLGRELLADQAC